MASVLLYPLRKEAGTLFLPQVLLIHGRLMLLKRANLIKSEVSRKAFKSAPGEVFYHFILLFLFIGNDRTSNNSLDSETPLRYRRGGTLFFSELSHSEVISGLFLIVNEKIRLIRGCMKNRFYICLHPIFAGYKCCLMFVREERNEVCTDNLPVLRDWVFI